MASKINLSLKAPAKWIRKPIDVRTEQGASVEVICSASGEPNPLISWKKMEGTLVLMNTTVFEVNCDFNSNFRFFRTQFAPDRADYEN